MLFININLINARQVNLGRVFRRCNVYRLRIQNIQTGIERHSLSRTCRTGYQHHAVRTVDSIQQQFLLKRLKTKLIDIQRSGIRIQNPHHNLFAKQRRQRADTEIDRLATLLEGQLHPTVLRYAFFGNIQARHYLNPRSKLPPHRNRGLDYLAKLPVHTEPDTRIMFVKLKMNIRCPTAQSIRQSFMDKPRYRTVFRLFIINIQGMAFLLLLFRTDFLKQRSRARTHPFQQPGQPIVFDNHQLNRNP